MRITVMLTTAAVLVLAPPALARDTYRGDIRGGGGGNISFNASSGSVTNFVVNNVKLACRPDGANEKGTLGVKRAKINGNDRFKGKGKDRLRDRGLVLIFEGTVRGNFNEDREEAKGSVRFEQRASFNGQRRTCKSKNLRWDATRR